MGKHEIVVVGAGPAGLAAAAALQRRGLAPVVLERGSQVAAAWRSRPAAFRLTGSRRVSALPGLRYPAGTPPFPGRDDLIAYLERFAAPLTVRTGITVRRVDAGSVRRWRLETSQGDWAADHVILATGHFAEPYLPPWPGREALGRRLQHAADYRGPDGLAGTDVLVVGAGTSGLEIAAEAAAAEARRVLLAVRTPPNLVPRAVGALPGLKLMLTLPPRIGDLQIGLVRRLMIGDLSGFGLAAPTEGPFTVLRREGREPTVVDVAAMRAVRSGRVRVVPAVVALSTEGAFLADGSRAAVDRVIAATGYRPALARLVGHLGVLDAAGMPRPPWPAALHPLGFTGPPGQLPFLGSQAEELAAAVVAESSRVGGA